MVIVEGQSVGREIWEKINRRYGVNGRRKRGRLFRGEGRQGLLGWEILGEVGRINGEKRGGKEKKTRPAVACAGANGRRKRMHRRKRGRGSWPLQ
jgi:hypothetical protein